MNDRTVNGTPNEVLLTAKRWSPTIMLASGDGVVIDARYKIRRFRSRISAHKSTGLQMRIRYQCYVNGSKQKIKMTRNFFAESDRSFKENQKFYFSRGLMNMKVQFEYAGKLPV
jgi:hypothetical protein